MLRALQLEQKTHQFPFGAAIVYKHLFPSKDVINEDYRDYFVDNFNFATPAISMKWRFMESKEVLTSNQAVVSVVVLSHESILAVLWYPLFTDNFDDSNMHIIIRRNVYTSCIRTYRY